MMLLACGLGSIRHAAQLQTLNTAVLQPSDHMRRLYIFQSAEDGLPSTERQFCLGT